MVFILVSYYNTTSEDKGRRNKRKDGGLRHMGGGGMRAHPWQDVSSVNTHCRTLTENSIRRDRGLQQTQTLAHKFTHSAMKLSVQIAIVSADASPASLLSKNPFWGFQYQDSSWPCVQAKLLAGLMIRYQLAMSHVVERCRSVVSVCFCKINCGNWNTHRAHFAHVQTDTHSHVGKRTTQEALRFCNATAEIFAVYITANTLTGVLRCLATSVRLTAYDGLFKIKCLRGRDELRWR